MDRRRISDLHKRQRWSRVRGELKLHHDPACHRRRCWRSCSVLHAWPSASQSEGIDHHVFPASCGRQRGNKSTVAMCNHGVAAIVHLWCANWIRRKRVAGVDDVKIVKNREYGERFARGAIYRDDKLCEFRLRKVHVERSGRMYFVRDLHRNGRDHAFGWRERYRRRAYTYSLVESRAVGRQAIASEPIG